MTCASNGCGDILRLLVDSGAGLEEKDRNGCTALHFAAWYGRTEILKILLEANCNPNEISNEGWTALHYAASEGKIDVIKMLLATNKIELNQRDKQGYSSVQLACGNGHISAAMCLLSQPNISVSDKNNLGWTTFMFSCEKGYMEVVKSLMMKGVDVNDKDVNGATALMYAIEYQHLEIARFILDQSKNTLLINDNNNFGWTVLMMSIDTNATDLALFILENFKDCDITKKNEAGWNALMIATVKNAERVVEKLATCDPSVVNEVDGEGNSAFIYAIINKSKRIARILADSNANLSLRNKAGLTALDIAKQNNNRSLVTLISRKLGDESVDDTEGPDDLPLDSSVDDVKAPVSASAVIQVDVVEVEEKKESIVGDSVEEGRIRVIPKKKMQATRFKSLSPKPPGTFGKASLAPINSGASEGAILSSESISLDL